MYSNKKYPKIKYITQVVVSTGQLKKEERGKSKDE